MLSVVHDLRTRRITFCCGCSRHAMFSHDKACFLCALLKSIACVCMGALGLGLAGTCVFTFTRHVIIIIIMISHANHAIRIRNVCARKQT